MSKENSKIVILPISRDYPDPDEETSENVVRVVIPTNPDFKLQLLGVNRDYGEEDESKPSENQE